MSDTLPPWLQPLQPASWNGIEFGVLSRDFTQGRRNVPHMYPFRDTPWVEDLGAALQTITYEAYLVGDDVYEQEGTILAAFDTADVGNLVDPDRGSVWAKVGNTSFNFNVGKGRVVSMQLEFILTSQFQANSIGPFTQDDTSGEVDDSADDLDDAADDDFLDDVGDTITEGINNVGSVINTAVYAVNAITNTVESFAGQVIGVISDASMVVNAVQGIGFALSSGWTAGRYEFGSLTIAPTALLTIPTGLPINDQLQTATQALLDAATVNRATITNTANLAVIAVAFGYSVPSAVQLTTEALRNASAPSDAIRLLSGLASFQATDVNSTSPIGEAIATAIAATAAVSRRAALSSIARACASYSPSSSNDATNTVAFVRPLFDAEISYASSVSDSKTLQALKALRSKVIKDLNTRGSNLPVIQDVDLPSSIPLKRLAMRYYGSIANGQDMQILARNQNIAHPTFSGLGPIEIVSP